MFRLLRLVAWVSLPLLALVAGLAWYLGRQSALPPPPPGKPGVTPVAQATPPPAGPKLALVLDDWGYLAKPMAELEKLGYPITVAVIPGQAYSKQAAEIAHKAGHEVIVHLPMLPKAKLKLSQGTLKPGMPEVEVARLLEAHWDGVPHAVGLNNHEGSAGTEDKALMAQVAGFLKAKGAYFLDSLTTPKSRGKEVARAARIPFAARRVFLDNVDKPDAIRAQLAKAAQIALKSGSCIAIGHPHEATLSVLLAEGPALKAQGLQLVRVSALVQRPD